MNEVTRCQHGIIPAPACQRCIEEGWGDEPTPAKPPEWKCRNAERSGGQPCPADEFCYAEDKCQRKPTPEPQPMTAEVVKMAEPCGKCWGTKGNCFCPIPTGDVTQKPASNTTSDTKPCVTPIVDVRPWYKDRDFPEIKVSNAEVLAVVQQGRERLITEHNALLATLAAKDAEIERLKAGIESTFNKRDADWRHLTECESPEQAGEEWNRVHNELLALRTRAEKAEAEVERMVSDWKTNDTSLRVTLKEYQSEVERLTRERDALFKNEQTWLTEINRRERERLDLVGQIDAAIKERDEARRNLGPWKNIPPPPSAIQQLAKERDSSRAWAKLWGRYARKLRRSSNA